MTGQPDGLESSQRVDYSWRRRDLDRRTRIQSNAQSILKAQSSAPFYSSESANADTWESTSRASFHSQPQPRRRQGRVKENSDSLSKGSRAGEGAKAILMPENGPSDFVSSSRESYSGVAFGDLARSRARSHESSARANTTSRNHIFPEVSTESSLSSMYMSESRSSMQVFGERRNAPSSAKLNKAQSKKDHGCPWQSTTNFDVYPSSVTRTEFCAVADVLAKRRSAHSRRDAAEQNSRLLKSSSTVFPKTDHFANYQSTSRADFKYFG